MKNYYYFLGISEEATSEDIKKAYRKLSLKYHPDKNENDSFFVERFREVQEAYEVLINSSSRSLYDQKLAQIQQNIKSDQPPYIKTFHANKLRVKKGEEIILNWQTQNADVIKIIPFGLVKNYGEKRVKITQFDANGECKILLNATNTLLQKTVAKGITIKEIQEVETPLFETHFTNTKQQSNIANRPSKLPYILALLLVILLLFWLFR
ncbi:J domain-containing protein [Riemerella anatipestifer]|uniref:J domain-containing protein n=1 Tax=Riemerella anatipestifer TaxID=34085 RepID=A0AAP6LN75_RIEAN|nr:J domain-containing protein [Riemerella anatipestifer]ADQ81870.1 heat shock protein DnaJ domain protein [Riemerella anatipestifer ATCC 11845 = DSM 15868]ADZ12628.1 Hsp40 protein [Riemerella anatipestifer RA-GD]AGC40216.1 DnaJ-class molecular chaperone with C-terminal Zn finger domain [Riemerella anatipestifer RA-CH-2]AKP69109.1 heat shock protein dnaj domain-containing protein [Riemerella anatipestifer]AKP70983.1 heat shock protein dnaj domain-containing protein [Riemerella anatipestifer]